LRQLLLCAAVIVSISMGIRHGFGLWLQPVITEREWTRETFSLAMAVQNICWGLGGPLVGWWADRKGALGALVLGALLYLVGLLGMAWSTTPTALMLSMGVLIGLAQACTTYTVLYGVLGRHVAPAKRSWAMGIIASAGSFGQFLVVPGASWLIQHLGWHQALWVLAAVASLIIPMALGLRDDPRHPPPLPSKLPRTGAPATGLPPVPAPDSAPASALHALQEAFTHPGYLLLTAGYFVCGFQLAFIGVHLPSYLLDHQLAPQVATTALALIGLFNVLGTYAAGALGQRWRKNWILSGIYALRGLAIAIFVLTPLSAVTVGIFAAVMGALWLSTVPPTNAIVAQMLGVRHLGLLGALVFLSHQIGSFFGVWLGGRLYDAWGSYTLVWWVCVALSALAALLNLPIREHQLPRRRLAPSLSPRTLA